MISPFIDKQHGTERAVAEQISRLAKDYGWDVHIYSSRVEGVTSLRRFKDARKWSSQSVRSDAQREADALSDRDLVWHKVPRIPGPHLIQYLWWFVGNRLLRLAERLFHGLHYDVIYSPGINCLDASVISVHIVFAEFYRQVRQELQMRSVQWRSLPRLVHRRVYYALIIALERRIYGGGGCPLLAISCKVEDDLIRFYRPANRVSVDYYGVDSSTFNCEARTRLRANTRSALSLKPDSFCLLLVGNDWKKKGLTCLMEAISKVDASGLVLLVVGKDDRGPFDRLALQRGIQDCIRFLPLRPDVEAYYAAADACVAPSLEDAFALPPAEAMACGVPVIVSSRAGVSEWVTHGRDGLILRDPEDPKELASLIGMLYSNPGLCSSLGSAAAITACRYTWDANAKALDHALRNAMRSSVRGAGHAVEQHHPSD